MQAMISMCIVRGDPASLYESGTEFDNLPEFCPDLSC